MHTLYVNIYIYIYKGESNKAERESKREGVLILKNLYLFV